MKTSRMVGGWFLCLSAVVGLSYAASPEPGDFAAHFHVPTLQGSYSYSGGGPIVFHAFDSRSMFLQAMWSDNSSVADFLTYSPFDTVYVFMSYDSDAEGTVRWMHDRLKAVEKTVLEGNTNDHALRQNATSVLERAHFVTTPVGYLDVKWIPTVLDAWRCENHGCGISYVVLNTSSGQSMKFGRLDARYDWLPPFEILGMAKFDIAYIGTGCAGFVQERSEFVTEQREPGSFRPAPWLEEVAWQPAEYGGPATNLTGRIALVSDGGCSYYTKVSNAAKAGAKGVIVISGKGKPVVNMNCAGAECDRETPGIPAAMIVYESGQRIISELAHRPTVSFATMPTHYFHFAIDSMGRLAEVGWFLYPSLRFLTWQAEWLVFDKELTKRLAVKADIVSVFDESTMQGKTGAVAEVSIGSFDELRNYTDVQLDMGLSCPGVRDEDCAPWDRTVQLFVCCEAQSALCNYELGRWISPFRRRIGRWLTPITPLLPLLASSDGKCNFTMKTDWWAKPWKPSLNLRFGGKVVGKEMRAPVTDMEGKVVAPSKLVPLFKGGTFDKDYNSRYKPITFSVPSGVTRVELVSVITGHGSDENGCGEFCVTKHVFTVNHVNNTRIFTNAGTPLGCAIRTPLGVVPNEHGTWLYGRNGWCDGQQVDPWRVDITSQLNMAAENTILYQGYFNNHTPDPKRTPGEITMFSELVFYTPL